MARKTSPKILSYIGCSNNQCSNINYTFFAKVRKILGIAKYLLLIIFKCYNEKDSYIREEVK
jgi:hypothetical protein